MSGVAAGMVWAVLSVRAALPVAVASWVAWLLCRSGLVLVAGGVVRCRACLRGCSVDVEVGAGALWVGIARRQVPRGVAVARAVISAHHVVRGCRRCVACWWWLLLLCRRLVDARARVCCACGRSAAAVRPPREGVAVEEVFPVDGFRLFWWLLGLRRLCLWWSFTVSRTSAHDPPSGSVLILGGAVLVDAVGGWPASIRICRLCFGPVGCHGLPSSGMLVYRRPGS